MRLLAPAGLAALAALLPLTAWYLLRPRRRPVLVGSTFLWRSVQRPATATTPWQRFRGDATYWLGALALLALAGALARPAVPVPATLGDHTILVVDVSGSMLADEGGVTRAELARRAAADLTAALRPDQEVSIIAAGARPQVVLAGSSDAREVARTLARLPATHAPAELGDAFTLATSLQRPGERTVVHLLTDREPPREALALAPPALSVTGIGSDRPNVAVTRLQAAPAGGGDHRVLVQVRSYSSTAVTGRLVLSVDEITVVEQPLRLPPRGTEDVVLTVPGTPGAVLTARLRLEPDVTGEIPDALAFDDHASVLLAAAQELTVLVAGPGNAFVEQAFAAVPGVTLETAASVPASLAGVDLLVVDRIGAPDELTVPTVLIAPTVWPTGIEISGEVELPSLTYQASDHPLLADVDLTGLAVATAVTLDAPTLTPLASGPRGALLAAGRLGGVPLVVVPFDLTVSDLPLRAAWPLLVSNTTSWASGAATVGDAVPVGTTVTADTGGGRVLAHPPDGSAAVELAATGPTPPSLLLDRTGLWRLEAADGSEVARIGVVTAVDEGDLSAPRPATTTTPVGEGTGADTRTGLADVAPLFAVAALALLLIEWLWSQQLVPMWRRRRRQVVA